AISQTEEVQYEIQQLLRVREISLGIEHGQKNVCIYTILDSSVLMSLENSLKDMCNSALGDLADREATVSVNHHKLIVQSAARPFMVYANQVIRAYVGVAHDDSDQNSLPVNRRGNIDASGGHAMGGGIF
ncbi:MAG: hypothetical protein ACJ0BJ_04545, partial [Pirellulales bacterium]